MYWQTSEIYKISSLDGSVKYVGRTFAGIKWRSAAHLTEKSPLGDWARANRGNYKTSVLEVCSTENASDREKYWITKFREDGHALINVWPKQEQEKQA